MKKLFSILVMAMVIALSSLVFAFQNEPDGFRGIKWGTSINDLPDMELIEGGDYGDGRKSYHRRNDKMAIGNAKLKEIVYMFWQDQFFSVCIKTDELGLQRILSKIYGEHDKGDITGTSLSEEWIGENVNIFWSIKVSSYSGRKFTDETVYYTYKPIEKEMNEYLEQEEKRENKKHLEDAIRDL